MNPTSQSAGACSRPPAAALHGTALYIAAALAFLHAEASPADDGLFVTTDQNPFIHIYSLPSPALHTAPGHGRWAWRMELDVTNGAIRDDLPSGASVTLDGETYRSTFSLYHGLSERVTVGLGVPFVAHSGGFLDSFVRGWHDLFGLTNSRREEFEDDVLEYSYRDGATLFHMSERSKGIGDVRLTLDRRLGEPEAPRRMSLRAGLKLPTGSSGELHGSGSTDASLQLLAEDEATLSAWNTTLAWMIGGLWLGEGEVLDGLRRDVVAVGSIGVSRPVWRKLSLRLQLDGHSSFYDSDLRPLGSSSVQLAFGGSVALTHAGRIDLAMIENLFTDTTPDLVLHFAWRGAF